MSKEITVTIPNLEDAVARCHAALSVLGKDSGLALSRAVNRSLEAVRTEAAKIARSAYTARQSKLFDTIFLRRAGRQHPEGTLIFSGKKGVSLIHFMPRPSMPQKRPTSGVSTKIFRNGARRVREVPGYTKPFIMRKRQGGYGIFVRSMDGSFRDWGGMQMLLGPSPIQALGRADSREKLAEKAQEVFLPRLEHEIGALLSGVRGRK